MATRGHRRKRIVFKRSGLEDANAEHLDQLGVSYRYEEEKLEYRVSETRKYTPDFILPNNIIVETKGYLSPSDRKKHLLVKVQHPEADIRFVFGNSNNKIKKGSKTSYADWCKKNGFLYADKLIPESWINEPTKNPPEFLHKEPSKSKRTRKGKPS